MLIRTDMETPQGHDIFRQPWSIIDEFEKKVTSSIICKHSTEIF